jgi:hypothetical protein
MRRVLFQKYVRIALEAINSTSVSLPTICRFATAASLSPKISDRIRSSGCGSFDARAGG